MIQEDAVNLQKQLVNLFRTFEVDVAVGLHNRKKDYGVTLLSQDAQIEIRDIGKVTARPGGRRTKKKDPLSG